MLDLASRGYIAFREEPSGLLGAATRSASTSRRPPATPTTEAQRRLNARRPTARPRRSRSSELRALGRPRRTASSAPDDLPKFGTHVADFDTALEEHVVDRGWFGEAPSKVVARWAGRGVLAIVAGVIALIAGLNIPISGLTLHRRRGDRRRHRGHRLRPGRCRR